MTTAPLPAAGREQLGPLEGAARAAADELADTKAIERLWQRDHTLWQDDPTEVADRLGWLDSPLDMQERVAALDAFADQVAGDGLRHAVVLGMGGSSLFPEVLARTFPAALLELRILDTTDPAAVRRIERELPLDATLFVASSKSGTTIETTSALQYFRETVRNGSRFAAVTDPGTPLARQGRDAGFRAVFENRPDIGGRYSALSLFGLVPAALAGIDVSRLLQSAAMMLEVSAPNSIMPRDNPSLRLAAVLTAGVREGRDKLTVLLPPEVASFGAWLEQLVAESTGKQGTGIVPVVDEPLGPVEVYGDDRLFVTYGPAGVDALAASGHPVVELPLLDAHGLGAEVLRWELATALTGALLGINPFDQPDVAAAKEATARVLDAGVPDIEPEPLAGLLDRVSVGDYLAIQAYVDPGSPAVGSLQAARVALRDRLRVSTTLGLGPRYLHSTGQLHKGGPPSGVFVQVVSDDPEDVLIPGRPFGFSTLTHAQAAGDLAALQSRGLRAGRVALGELLEEAR